MADFPKIQRLKGDRQSRAVDELLNQFSKTLRYRDSNAPKIETAPKVETARQTIVRALAESKRNAR